MNEFFNSHISLIAYALVALSIGIPVLVSEARKSRPQPIKIEVEKTKH